MQQTLIVQGNNGYLHLAHRYGRAVQISVENFTDWDDAAGWRNAHGMHALLQFEGAEIPVKYWTIFRLMSRDKAHTTSELCALLASYRASIQHRSKGAPPSPPTPQHLRPSLAFMERKGFVTTFRSGIKGADWEVRRVLDPQDLIGKSSARLLASAA